MVFLVRESSDMSSTIVLTEVATNSKAKKVYSVRNNQLIVKSESQTSVKRNFSQVIKDIFLPEGFPHTVSEDYVQYEVWDSLQALFNGINGALATHAVLIGSGVGNEQATVTAATLTWLLRYASGTLGSILFAYVQGSKLDANCKAWRLFADAVNDSIVLLNLIAPFLGSIAFAALSCVIGLLGALVGVAGAATRVAIVEHQAIANNLGDLSAKSASQETVINFCSFIINVTFMPFVIPYRNLVWALFASCTSLHLYCNYRAVSSANIRTLNTSRLKSIIEHYLETKKILSIATANANESVAFWTRDLKTFVRFGSKLSDHTDESRELKKLFHLFDNEEYLLSIRRKRIIVSFSEGIEIRSILKALVHVILLDLQLNGSNLMASLDLNDNDNLKIVKETLNLTNVIYYGSDHTGCEEKRTSIDGDVDKKVGHGLVAGLAKEGYQLDRVLVTDDGWRYKRRTL